jgi:proton-coupled amino acid transporter
LLSVSGIALISLYSFLLLVDVKFTVGGSFGGSFPLSPRTSDLTKPDTDMGGILYGPFFRQAILFSITISQIGFVTAYMIFVSSSLAPVFCLPQHIMLLLQLPILIPIAMIRNLAKLSFTALIADGFILLGLLYIWGSEIGRIATSGIGKKSISDGAVR